MRSPILATTLFAATALLALYSPSVHAADRQTANPTPDQRDKPPVDDGRQPTIPTDLSKVVESAKVSGRSITITDNCGANELIITCDGVSTKYKSDALKTIDALLTGTNNSLTFNVGPGTTQLVHSRSIIIAGGTAADTIDIGPWKNDNGFGPITIKSLIDFDIATGYGQDTVSVLLGHVDEQGVFSVDVDLGPNDDRLVVRTEGTIDGRVDFVAGGGDNDIEDRFWLGFKSNIGPEGSLSFFGHGGHDPDYLECYYEGILEGDLSLYLNGNDFFDFVGPILVESQWELLEASALEPDVVVMDIRPLAGSNGSISASVEDGLGDDELILQVINEEGANTSFEGRLSGGYGFDRYYVTGYDGLPGELIPVDSVEEFVPDYRID